MSRIEGSSPPLVIEISDEEDTVEKSRVRKAPLAMELSDEEDATQKPKLHSQTGNHVIDLDDIPRTFDSSRGLNRPTAKGSTTLSKVVVLDFGQEGEESKDVDTAASVLEPTFSFPLPVMKIDSDKTESTKYLRPKVQNGEPQDTLDNCSASATSTITIFDGYESGPVNNNMGLMITGENLDAESAVTQPSNVAGIPQRFRNANSSDEQAGSAVQENTLEEAQRQTVNFDLVSDPAPANMTTADISRGPLPSFHTINAEFSQTIDGKISREQPTIRNAHDARRTVCLGESSLHKRPFPKDRELVTQHLADTDVPESPYRAPEAYMGPMPHSKHPRHPGKPSFEKIMPTSEEAVTPARTFRTSPARASVTSSSAPLVTTETMTETSQAPDNRRAIDQGILSEMSKMLLGQKRIMEEEEAERAMKAEIVYQKRHQGLKHLNHQAAPLSRSSARSSHSDLFIRSPTPPPIELKRKMNQAEVFNCSKRPKPVGDGSQKRRGEHLKLDDFWGSTKRSATESGTTRSYQNPLTLKDGYFDRHQERINALKARADRENRAYEQGYYDGQEVDLNLNETYTPNTTQTATRPTTGGKGLSQETMLKWRMDEAAQAPPTPNISEVGDEEVDVPKLLYEYHVQRQVTLDGQREIDGHLTSYGPYYTIEEANTVAAQKVRQHDPGNASMVFKRGGWSYNYEKDEIGTEHHTLGSRGGSIQTWVSRSIAPPSEGVGIPLKAFRIPSWLYAAMISFSTPLLSSADHSVADLAALAPNSWISPKDSPSASIIKACTLLDLANRAAGEKWVEMQAANLPKDGVGDILRSELEMNLRRDLEDMDEENESFNRKCRDAKTGQEIHIWVDMVEVEGPRN